MFRNHFKVALRNLRKNKAHSFINIAGLSAGMTVALLIGLWIWDEFSFDKYHENYSRIAEVEQNRTYNGNINTGAAIPIPLGDELHKNYGSDFKYIVMSSWTWNHVLTVGDKNVSLPGNFMEKDAPAMFSLHMLNGSGAGLADPSSILLAQSSAKALFGEADPLNQLVKLDNDKSFKVAGVYEDLPYNSTLKSLAFIAPWDVHVQSQPEQVRTDWGANAFQLYVQIADKADMAALSEKIKDVKLKKIDKEDVKYNPQLFLQPMRRWRLYSEFKNGVNTGGRIQYVRLFGIIGIFVLLLACINFMNLSTARSEKRAKEVGVRKAIGSLRGQLISQFFVESILVAMLAFILSLLLASMVMSFFNEVADKQMSILWTSPAFWCAGIGFSLITGIIAGSYPAFYLSSFRPVKVLKGAFRAGPLAAVPRKALVVLQFTVSVILIIGTIIVFKQIQYAKNRPVGYSRQGLVTIGMATMDLHNHFEAVRTDLLKSGLIAAVAQSSSSATRVNSSRGDVEWKGKDPSMTVDFANIRVTTDFGKTVGWQMAAGRDFSRDFTTDLSGVIINEAAVKYMGLKDPVGDAMRIGNKDYTIIGVIKDMVMESPYEPVKQTFFCLGNEELYYINIRISPRASAHDAISAIGSVCKKYSPAGSFSYKFADEEYARKFSDEERIGKLAGAFAILAIFISCLGLFGMATFMAEQRIKEIGVRKVLGASVFNLWGLLSKEFVTLVIIALLIAMPLAYYFMNNWLQNYQYRSDMPWWIFGGAAAGALLITVLTVSFQSIKAALMNPVKSLRSE